MSAKLVCDRLILTELPFKLDPQLIANTLIRSDCCSEATFASSVTVRYTPNVSSETPGQTVLAVFTRSVNSVREAHAAACKAISPIWKGTSLVIPKDLLRFEDWSRSSQPSLWLSCVNVQGTVDISCTIKCAVQFKLTPMPTSVDRLITLDTKCYLGPVLAGFSLVGCMPMLQTGSVWPGVGNVINISLKDGTGYATGNRYIRTPEARDYVAVRYGFGSKFDYVYTTANKEYSWRTYSSVVSKFNSTSSMNGAVEISYYGSWRPIKGGTNWWAEINPRKENVVSGGVSTPYYYPCAQLILYYEYPGVDIFSPDFVPYLLVHPGDDLPCPAGSMSPNEEQKLPLNHSRLQMTWNPAWRPVLINEPLALDMFVKAKQEFTSWPVNCKKTTVRGTSSDKFECDEGQDKSDDAENHGEPGCLTIDHSV